jgi:hypothetical protein
MARASKSMTSADAPGNDVVAQGALGRVVRQRQLRLVQRTLDRRPVEGELARHLAQRVVAIVAVALAQVAQRLDRSQGPWHRPARRLRTLGRLHSASRASGWLPAADAVAVAHQHAAEGRAEGVVEHLGVRTPLRNSAVHGTDQHP